MSEDVGAGPAPSRSRPPSTRVRARLARFGGHAAPTATLSSSRCCTTVRANHPKADLSVIERAYAVAERAHRRPDAQERRRLHHPPARGDDDPRRARHDAADARGGAAARHGRGHGIQPRRSCATDFGDEIAMLVDGVTKLDKVTYGDAAQAETVRKMVVAMARDIRVLVIKLADRLHNARTWRYVSRRVGPAQGPRDPRDLRAAGPPPRHEHHQVGARGPVVRDALPQGLRRDRAPGRRAGAGPRGVPRRGARAGQRRPDRRPRSRPTVTGRPKHYYSVYQKMIVRGRDFEDIYDLVAVRVLVDSVRDCYAALGALHARWNPVPGRFKDYIAMPKFNMYQSLHTTVIGPQGKPVEIQIRTHTMHRRAEYGVAAHWKYKEHAPARRRRAARRDRARSNDMAWLRQLLDWQRRPPTRASSSTRCASRSTPARSTSSRPRASVVALPAGAHPGRLRLRRAHRGRAPLHRRAGQRPARAARVDARERRRRRGAHLQGRRRRARRATGCTFVKSPRARNKIKPVVLQGAPRGGHRRRQGRDRQGDAQAEPAAAAPDDATSR